MADLTINTGVQEYVFNGGKARVYLNPADPAFAKRLYERFTELEEKDKAWRAKIAELSGDAIMAAWDEGDAMFREAIDDVLGVGFCAQLCGNVSVLAIADGMPIWMNILLAIIDIMDEAVSKEQKTVNPKLEKYLKKYHR